MRRRRRLERPTVSRPSPLLLMLAIAILIAALAHLFGIGPSAEIRDLGPCYEGMTLPPRSRCSWHLEIPIPEAVMPAKDNGTDI